MNPPYCIRLHFAAFACSVLFCASGCTLSDQEYSQKTAAARSNCTGKELIGIWVSKLNSWGNSAKTVLLIRPNGTGILRMNGGESAFNWTYGGSGLWHGVARREASEADAKPISPGIEAEAADSLIGCQREGGLRFTVHSESLNCASPRGISGEPSTDFSLSFRYNGLELLLEIHGGLGKMNLVFVRSDDDAAVEEHLKKRE